MTEDNHKSALEILESRNVIFTNGHFVYESGKHGTTYVDKYLIYPHIEDLSFLCKQIAENFYMEKIDAVIAPVMGGVVISQWTAHHLTALTGQKIMSLFSEKNEREGGFRIRSSYDQFISGKKVLVVEDIINTGTSARKVGIAVRKSGGNVIGVGAICNRGNATAHDLQVPTLKCLVQLELTTWEESACPLCKSGVPVNTNLGKGARYIKNQKKE